MTGLRRIIKNIAPYGVTCAWKRRRYGIVEDRPLLYYPGLCKRLKRIVKFSLPYFLVSRVKRPYVGGGGRIGPLPRELTCPLPADSSSVLSAKVVIIAELSIPQCKYYRVDQKVRMLERLGARTQVVSWMEAAKARHMLQTATLVIFYRVPYTEEVQKFYEEAHRLGIRIGFDIDDLVFDVEEYRKNPNLQRLPSAVRDNLLAGAELYKQALAAADFSIASTPKLQSFMKKYCEGPSYVIPNAVREHPEGDRVRYSLGLGGEVVIGYGSGTDTHDDDFAVCASAVAKVMSRCPNVLLVIHGSLRLPQEFDAYSCRIRRVPFVPFDDYADAVARFDVNLAPLVPNVFNDCKSNIKFLEAAMNSVPSVASPRAEFASIIRDGENGFLAGNEDEWVDRLSRLVESSELRSRLGRAARESALDRVGENGVADSAVARMLRAEMKRLVDSGRKRILEVNVLYAPVSFGGATVQTENLVGECSKRADVAVFCATLDVRFFPGCLTRYEHRGVPCFMCEVRVPDDPDRNYEMPEVDQPFEDVLRAFRPDIVHFNSIQFLGVGMCRACRKRGIPYVVTAHDAWWLCPRQFMLDGNGKFCGQDKNGIDLYRCAQCVTSRDLFERWRLLTDALKGAKCVLTPSDYQRDLYVKSGLPPELVLTNRNGIVVPADVPPHTVHPKLTFAYLGGKCDHKGYYWLQRIVRRLHGDFRLKLVDINMKFGQRTIHAVEWHGTDVECCKPFDSNDIDEFYCGIDVLLFPSCCKESFGLTVRDALARNIWVIATDAGGDIGRDLKSGENGDLVAMGDEEGFAAAMQRLIDEPRRLEGFVNPYRMRITTVEQQTEELLNVVRGVK